jgi:CRP-like cAMP-binding protein
MRTCMIIPTYWGGPGGAWEEGDAVYDHATPLDEEGTLLRALKSIDTLSDKDFTLIILAAATNLKYVKPMEEKLTKMLTDANLPVNTILFTESNLRKMRSKLYDGFKMEDILSLRGYSNNRNLCMFLPYILDAEVAILIDDDEVFEDSQFVTKAKEFVGKRFYGNTVDGVAGYYLNEDNEYYDKVNIAPWMTYWDRFGGKREAFDKVIGGEPRLKKTPFAFGGAMVIHRNLMRIVPFDPKITRGEDTDYVINSRIFGFNFYLDNQLAIKHLPPPKNHPIWKRFREDIYRFLYDKSKFDNQKVKTNLHRIAPEDFDPYPGQFMKPDLGDKIFKTNIILALNYLADGDVEACKKTIENIYLARYEAIPHYDTYDEYLKFQKKWKKLLDRTKDFGSELKDIIHEGQIIEQNNTSDSTKEVFFNSGIFENIDLQNVMLFKGFSKKELERLFEISEIIDLKADEYLFKTGDLDDNIYILLQGKLQVLKESTNGGENLIVMEFLPGEHLNETAIFVEQPHRVSIKAIPKSKLMKISKKKALNVLSQNTEIAAKILWKISKKLSERLKQTTQKFTDTLDRSSDVSDHMDIVEKS